MLTFAKCFNKIMNCENCRKPLTKLQTRFCSRQCFGLNKRGTGKNHIRILVNGERVYLHRYLVETHIRPLQAGEIVHHIDENKFNNSLGNLEILDGRAKHLHLHNYFRGYRKRKTENQVIDEFDEFGF